MDENPTFAEAVSHARKMRGISLEEFGRAMGISQTAAHQRDRGKVQYRHKDLQGLAKVLDVEARHLHSLMQLFEEDPVKASRFHVVRPPGMNAEEWRLERLGVLSAIEDTPLKFHGPRSRKPQGSVRVLGDAPAALPLDTEAEEIDGVFAKSFGVRVRGDSMHPTLQDGDIGIFESAGYEGADRLVVDGNVVFVRFTQESDRPGEAMIGRFFGAQLEDRRCLITKDNPDYPVVYTQLEDIDRIAVLTEIRRRMGEQ